MAAKLVVTKESGEVLFDTSKISYGFVKSAYLVADGVWGRYQKPYTNTDPDDGRSWVLIQNGDYIHKFTVENVTNPIVFLTGEGTLTGRSVSGNTHTFYYTNASTSTKAFCFDLMSDRATGSPYLKTYNEQGVITFNSLQQPLNVVVTVTPPAPAAIIPDGYNANSNCYNGGTYSIVNYALPQLDGVICRYTVALTANVEYAAHIPFTRSCRCDNNYSSRGPVYIGMVEGCGGTTGGVTFMFGPAGATTDGYFTFGAGYRAQPHFYNIPTDRYPTALIIRTSEYPFPYG